MDKNVKNEVKVIKKNEDNEKITVEERMTIKELEDKIESMKADKEKKCKAAKEQLVSMLEVTVDKYRTATGTAEALRTLRFVTGNDLANLTWANQLAWDMAAEVNKMCEKAKKLSYAEMDQLCDDFYDKEFRIAYPPRFSNDEIPSIEEEHCYCLAFEMMRIDLCRNVGGTAEDMVEFIKRVEEEIDATGKELKKLKAKEK